MDNTLQLLNALRRLEDAATEILERKHSDLHQVDRDMLHDAVAVSQKAILDHQKGHSTPQDDAEATEGQGTRAMSLVRTISRLTEPGQEFEALEPDGIDDLCDRLNAGSPTPLIAVIVEGGMVQEICIQGTAPKADFVVIDYDTKNTDPQDCKILKQENGGAARVLISDVSITKLSPLIASGVRSHLYPEATAAKAEAMAALENN